MELRIEFALDKLSQPHIAILTSLSNYTHVKVVLSKPSAKKLRGLFDRLQTMLFAANLVPPQGNDRILTINVSPELTPITTTIQTLLKPIFECHQQPTKKQKKSQFRLSEKAQKQLRDALPIIIEAKNRPELSMDNKVKIRRLRNYVDNVTRKTLSADELLTVCKWLVFNRNNLEAIAADVMQRGFDFQPMQQAAENSNDSADGNSDVGHE